MSLLPQAKVTSTSGNTLASATVAVTTGSFSNDGDTLTAVTSGTSITAIFSGDTLTLSGIDTRTMDTIATIETRRGEHGVTADPTGRYAFVTNRYADDVACVDLAKRTVVARTKVGALPNGISFSPLQLRDDVPARLRLRPIKVSNDEHDHDGDAQ